MHKLNGQPVDHAGDGVYVVVDAIGVWLHANHHENPTDRVYVEDKVMDAILRIRENGRQIIRLEEEAKTKTILCPLCGSLTQLCGGTGRECLKCGQYMNNLGKI